jgi:hypothetical protein
MKASPLRQARTLLGFLSKAPLQSFCRPSLGGSCHGKVGEYRAWMPSPGILFCLLSGSPVHDRVSGFNCLKLSPLVTLENDMPCSTDVYSHNSGTAPAT